MPGRSANFSRQSYFFILIVVSGALVSCGAPGEPQPPSPPIPIAISDLTAHQQGNGIQLVFTLPSRTTSGDRLVEPPAAEIFRGSLKPNGAPDKKSFKLVYTIPGALADVYSYQGKIQFTDPLPAEELHAHPGVIYSYRVKSRASNKKDSADSNLVSATVYPVPNKIAALNVHVTQDAIKLSWPSPATSAIEARGTILAGYHIYRGEIDSAASIPNPNDLSQVKWKSAPILLAPSQTNDYRDTLFDFGKTYVYQVRSVIVADGNPIESDDSAPAIVTPRDTFPPAPPHNVVAVPLPGENNSAVVDLSWSINSEPDLAGYRIYRSEKPSERGQPLAVELLLSPAYRDIAVQPGHSYWYVVTAIDRAGNESAPSEPAAADLTQPLP